MNDFLNNPEEKILSFNVPARDLIKKGNSEKKKISQQKKNNKAEVKQEKDAFVNDQTFTIKISRKLEAPIHTALLRNLQVTGRKMSIKQFVSNAIEAYLRTFSED